MNAGKLPVVATALDAWRTLFDNFVTFLRLALPLALVFAMLGAPFRSPNLEEAVLRIGIFLCLAAFFAFHWMRLRVGGTGEGFGMFSLVSGIAAKPQQFLSFLKYYIGIVAIFVLLMGCLLFLGGFVFGLMMSAQPLEAMLLGIYGAAFVIKPIMTFTHFSLSLILELIGLLTLPVIARYMFVLPAVSLGHGTGFKLARTQSQDLGWRLSGALALAVVPVLFVSEIILKLHDLYLAQIAPSIWFITDFIYGVVGFAGVAALSGVKRRDGAGVSCALHGHGCG